METLYCKNLTELKREKKFLERTFKIKIDLQGRKVLVEGEALDEFEMEAVIDAINLGFSARTAALIKEKDIVFEKINIKDYTRRKNLEIVRGRLIGTHGKTKNTLEQISGCEIKIKDNIVGVIGEAESVADALIAITNIVRGSKQTNVYKFLERINAGKKTQNYQLKNKNKLIKTIFSFF